MACCTRALLIPIAIILLWVLLFPLVCVVSSSDLICGLSLIGSVVYRSPFINMTSKVTNGMNVLYGDMCGSLPQLCSFRINSGDLSFPTSNMVHSAAFSIFVEHTPFMAAGLICLMTPWASSKTWMLISALKS